MKSTATIRPTEPRTLQPEADNYQTAKAQIEAQVPEGWQILTTQSSRQMPLTLCAARERPGARVRGRQAGYCSGTAQLC